MILGDAETAALERALELARRGEGLVEPNPMVGAVVLGSSGQAISDGWHARFGGPHAEVAALSAAGDAARGNTLVVTLEPCCHHGKTPPCTDAILTAGIRRVVVGAVDPASHGAGRGIARLRDAGVDVAIADGALREQAERLIAPFATLTTQGRPWVTAKWAMSLDGHVATASGESRWISSEASRSVVHRLRARVDAILVGIGTALADDPLLTARPPGPRTLLRIVLDSTARLPPASQLVRTAREHPVLVAVGPEARRNAIGLLEKAGCEVWQFPAAGPAERLADLLAELGRRQLTNLLVEGGPTVLGGFFDAGLVDEVQAFIAPKIIGGDAAPAAVAGLGIRSMHKAPRLSIESIESLGNDCFICGTIARS
jgi:diaminohydroxyphosphoribosylaminopyrimidine deaminase/5-amino-6-(5-phosphoribosylamino)uracil reductase